MDNTILNEIYQEGRRHFLATDTFWKGADRDAQAHLAGLTELSKMLAEAWAKAKTRKLRSGDKEYMQLAAQAVADVLPDGFVFFILCAPSGTGDGRANYTANAERVDCINMMKEFIIRNGAGEDWMKHQPK